MLAMNGSGARLVTRPLKWLLALMLVVAASAILFRKPVQEAVLLRSLLMVDAASETAFLDLADGSKNRYDFLQRVWNTRKIPHRTLVATYLKDNAGASPDLYRLAESLLISAATDVDASVRELALATLAHQKHPAVPRLAAALLRDADPQMRLLGVQYLRKQDGALALPVVFKLLDDPDLLVVTTADAALRNWTKQDFKVRIVYSGLDSAGGANSPLEPANLKIIQEGVARWKEWWQAHQQDYPADRLSASAPPRPLELLPVADFHLKDLRGNAVRFSNFKGKIVLLNFWTTWCPGCVLEMPDLIELQKRNAERLVVFGISLDGQTEPDEHGHLAGSHSDDGAGHEQGEAIGKVDLAEIRAKVEQFVKHNAMNYPVLLDPSSEVGRRFNGGELPMNVLIDGQGFVRRRFIGGRRVAAFETMIDELASPQIAR
jgi:thiol-disulfide isomerase/thioredoxin